MRNNSLFLLLVICIFTFQQAQALRRIKRGSIATQNKTKLSNDFLTDQRSITNDIKMAAQNEHTATTSDVREDVKGHAGHAWAKKAVAAVEHAIDKAFASLSHTSDAEKTKKSTEPNHSPQQLAGAAPKLANDGSVVSKDLHKPSLAYLLNNGGFGERFFDDMQHGAAFGSGEGAAEVLIIDNGLQPMMGMQHGLNSFTFRQPNSRSIANSLKRLSEMSKVTKLNSRNSLKINTDHSNNIADNNNVVGKLSNDNGFSEGNSNKDAVLKNNKRNENHNNSVDNKSANDSMGDARKRNNDHAAYGSENNSKAKHNGISNNNNNIGDKSNHTNGQQPEMKESSLSTLLSQKPGKVYEKSQDLQQRMKHDNEKAANTLQEEPNKQAKMAADLRQQALQVFKHSNGKTLPMESHLKFANMMLYKVGPDGAPIHAQGAQLSVNGKPTTSVISIGPAVGGAEDADAMDFLYNSIDPQLSLLHNSAGTAPILINPSNSALLSRPFLLSPYSLAGPTQPINFIENALDLLLSAEDEGNDELELVCPIHHPKKKSSDSSGDEGKDKDGVIQVCSCRFFKKSKNA